MYYRQIRWYNGTERVGKCLEILSWVKIMKIISIKQSNLDMEYKGKVIRFHGEITSGGFVAWIDSTEWLPADSENAMTIDEKLYIMKEVNKYVWDGYCRIVFMDDEDKGIYFDLYGNPLIRLNGEKIKSSKVVSINCFCDISEEIDGFSGDQLEFKRRMV